MYDFKKIESKWQKKWKDNQQYKVTENDAPKYYVLDMFPYPSGAGLHVGHPLGYICSDIYARYKKLKGFNVLHPMGYDAFGLPAEQYAILTGQHPEVTTMQNIKRYRLQLDKIGLSFDWDREQKTCDPEYYKWTQWTFIQMFNSFYDEVLKKARPIEVLIKKFEQEGSNLLRIKSLKGKLDFSASEWNKFSDLEKSNILQKFRLAYLDDMSVNWCSELGTVLANDEIKDGMSVRGGYPVVQKKMKQWCLRVSSYADRLLSNLEQLDWSDSLKEVTANWIGKSYGTELNFKVVSNELNSSKDCCLEIFTTRPDTIFGVSFMVLAPESDLAIKLTTEDNRKNVDLYLEQVKKKTERDRLSGVKDVTGAFTGSYAINPFTEKKIPIWIADYVLAGYGTGAIMAVPAHDSRDYSFAKKFNLEILEVVKGGDITKQAFESNEGELVNSDFLNGLSGKQAIATINKEIEKRKIGQSTINYRLRNAIFSRQRYWGEPIPIYYKNGIPTALNLEDLPLKLPVTDSYLPTKEGLPPLARVADWKTKDGYPLEVNTMPGFAGSSIYFLRYMDPKQKQSLVSKEKNSYWQDVDLYIGGTEHATGHLIYSRFWNMFLFDMGYIVKEEPYKKLFNQGMIQGRSNFVYRIKESNKFVSYGLKDTYEVQKIHVDVNIVDNDILNVDAFKKWREEFSEADFLLEEIHQDGEIKQVYKCGYGVEKMSKSLYNVVNPDDIIQKYGADTLRLYEMFLGPVNQSKPWNTSGIEGVARFLQKVWKLFFEGSKLLINDNLETSEELKALHSCLKKVSLDMEVFSFNTSISAFMILVNELNRLKCNKRSILKTLVIMLSPFVPHIAEELWEVLDENGSVFNNSWPQFEEKYLIEDSYNYPISINGKMRFLLELPIGIDVEEVKKMILKTQKGQDYLQDKTIKKIIFKEKKIINFVV